MKNEIQIALFLILLICFLNSCFCDYSKVKPGEISVLSPIPEKIYSGDNIELNINVDNPNNCPVSYIWESTAGKIEPQRGMSNVRFKVPCETGIVRVICKIVKENDTSELVQSKYVDVNVLELKPLNLTDNFVPSGWMEADLSNLSIDQTEYLGRTCNKIRFTPSAPSNIWGGIYWLNGGGFTTAKPVDLKGYQKITFWACARGTAKIEFIAGSDDMDSFKASTGVTELEESWHQYSIDLKGKDLSKVVGGFCWVASSAYNPGTIIFYLANIRYESGRCD